MSSVPPLNEGSEPVNRCTPTNERPQRSLVRLIRPLQLPRCVALGSKPMERRDCAQGGDRYQSRRRVHGDVQRGPNVEASDLRLRLRLRDNLEADRQARYVVSVRGEAAPARSEVRRQGRQEATSSLDAEPEGSGA